ncbi:hypothetical protein [Corallibacter sp.]|uniref:hypothetical protein n=1 Tax=Corallibacter sp. TaxID=2038084 RepID=UPI003AB8AEEF
MIKATQLTNQLVSISANLKGVKLFNYNLTDKDVEEIIEADITSYFMSINRINLKVKMEDVDDDRTLSQACILQIEMLLSFDIYIDEEDIHIIQNYLNKNFIEEII